MIKLDCSNVNNFSHWLQYYLKTLIKSAVLLIITLYIFDKRNSFTYELVHLFTLPSAWQPVYLIFF